MSLTKPGARRTDGRAAGSSPAGIDLYWLPLGAGGHSVRWNGRVYEMVMALLQRRTARALYHSALVVSLPPDTWVIEMTPVGIADHSDHRVLAEGPVGARWAGRSRLFRYEVHCWPGGVIADLAEAVASPVRLSSDEATCRQVLALIPSVPTPTWGRDELGTGEMWNSNSVTSWVLTRACIDALALSLPPGGRAPGWSAGVTVAHRQQAAISSSATESMSRPDRWSSEAIPNRSLDHRPRSGFFYRDARSEANRLTGR
jgi:hypothetical protein